ncbi:PAP fimbrial minor pilin protein precursor [Serratia fonticola]|nr:PAP fimbrial minor pilin protein precursor [Serratia fonticola]
MTRNENNPLASVSGAGKWWVGFALLLWLPASHAVDTWAVEGATGTLFVRGALTESACRLEMDSAYQDIWLGETATGRLQQIGAQGTPQGFELRLKDCLRSPVGSRDKRNGVLAWANNQPAVTVSFKASRDTDNPQLVQVQGVSGLGLRLIDSMGQDVRLGDRGKPLLLSSGGNTLTYKVLPERTPTSLVVGKYQAVVDFHLDYD